MTPARSQIHTVQYLAAICERDGGVVRFVLNLCRDLARREHRVTLLTQDDLDVPDDWGSHADDHPATMCIGKRGGGSLFRTEDADSVAGSLLRESDVFHLHTIWDPFNLALIRAARRLGKKPFVISCHGMLNDHAIGVKAWRKRLYLKIFGGLLLRDAACVHCASEGERQQAAKWIPHERIAVIPLSFDRSEFENLPGPELAHKRFPFLADGKPVVLMLGRLHPVKRLELLVEAMAKLHEAGRPAQLLLAGPSEPQAYVEKLTRLQNSLGLAGSVHFVGSVGGQEKLSLYQAADVFALPSAQENFGMVLAEALACRTPVVTTRAVNTWPEIAAAGGVLVEPTAEAFAEAFRDLLADPQRRKSLGRQGREYVFDWLDPAKVMVRYEEMYRNAIRLSPSLR